jgi:hypothetical protein
MTRPEAHETLLELYEELREAELLEDLDQSAIPSELKKSRDSARLMYVRLSVDRPVEEWLRALSNRAAGRSTGSDERGKASSKKRKRKNRR